MTISDAIVKFGVTRRTLYRWIENGEIEARKVGGKWFVSDENDVKKNDIDYDIDMKKYDTELVTKLYDEIEYLREQLDKAAESQQQSNMIVMQLTKQLEGQQLLLEDMRNRSLWKRFKHALGFAS